MQLANRRGLAEIQLVVIGSCADRFVPAGCGFLQYADDLMVYVTHKLIEVARGLIQTACTSLGVFYSSMGLTISSAKSDVMLLSRKHECPPISDSDGKSLKQEGFRTPSCPGSLLDHGLRNGGQRENL
jgi:hypothetical protein